MGQARQRRGSNKLSPRKVATIAEPGRHSDGGGLYLVVDKSGARRWVFMFRWKPHAAAKGAGKMREMGLGGFNAVSLAKAREKAADARAQLADGIDPIAARDALLEIPTFGQVADTFLERRESENRADKTLARWKRSLEVYAKPLRELRVDAVSTEDVLAVLKPIWTTKRETAVKARGAIEAVLNAAKAKGHRHGDNPARWRGHLDHLLEARDKLAVNHHAAIAYGDLPTFMIDLRGREAVAGSALEFLILTAARSGEVLGATWAEIDLVANIWTVPAERMKAGREHRVPLSPRAVEILTKRQAVSKEGLVFGSAKGGGQLSGMAMAMLMRRMKRDETVHGFRSSFRDWAGSATTFPRELAEAALAHTIGDETERAYRRDDALAKRRKMMDAWANYLAPKVAGSNVRPMVRAG